MIPTTGDFELANEAHNTNGHATDEDRFKTIRINKKNSYLIKNGNVADNGDSNDDSIDELSAINGYAQHVTPTNGNLALGNCPILNLKIKWT